jgi:hypothetical protein
MTEVLIDSKSDDILIKIINWCYNNVNSANGPVPFYEWDWDFPSLLDDRIADLPLDIRKNMVSFTFKSKEWATIFSLKWV